MENEMMTIENEAVVDINEQNKELIAAENRGRRVGTAVGFGIGSIVGGAAVWAINKIRKHRAEKKARPKYEVYDVEELPPIEPAVEGLKEK